MSTPNNGINGTLGTGLIGHYSFGGGSLLDESGNGRNLVCINTQVLATDKDGNANNAVNLYNTSYYKTNDANNPLNTLSNWTISIWLNIKNYINNEGYLSLKNSSGAPYNMYCDGLTLSQIRFHNDKLIRFDRTIGWHNIIMEFNGTSISAYFDSVLKGSDTASIINEVGNNLIFGKRIDVLSRKPNTDYDEIRMYNRLLTAGEKTELQTMGVNYTPILKCETPVANPIGGNYEEPQIVELSCATPDINIYYTLNGATPSSSSAIYISPLQIFETTTIKAIAIDPLAVLTDSDILTETYTITYPLETITLEGFYQTKLRNEVTGEYIFILGKIDTTPTTFAHVKKYNMYGQLKQSQVTINKKVSLEIGYITEDDKITLEKWWQVCFTIWIERDNHTPILCTFIDVDFNLKEEYDSENDNIYYTGVLNFE